jgi:hypothetical protein
MKLLLASILVAGAACTPKDSAGIPSSELQAQLQVETLGDGTATVSAYLYSHQAGDPPLDEASIQLVDGDQLVATSLETDVVMQETYIPVVNEYRYDAMFPSNSEGQLYAIQLDRVSDQASLGSTVTMPAAFDLHGVDQGSRAQPITVTWSPSGTQDGIKLELAGCGGAELGPLADTGTATLPAGMLSSTTDSCEVTLTVTRARMGSLSSGFGQGGSIQAFQTRSTTFVTSP